jgi:hypothetical protein
METPSEFPPSTPSFTTLAVFADETAARDVLFNGPSAMPNPSVSVASPEPVAVDPPESGLAPPDPSEAASREPELPGHLSEVQYVCFMAQCHHFLACEPGRRRHRSIPERREEDHERSVAIVENRPPRRKDRGPSPRTLRNRGPQGFAPWRAFQEGECDVCLTAPCSVSGLHSVRRLHVYTVCPTHGIFMMTCMRSMNRGVILVFDNEQRRATLGK